MRNAKNRYCAACTTRLTGLRHQERRKRALSTFTCNPSKNPEP